MKIIRFESIDSTNTYALKNCDDLEHKTIIVADRQTMGRGRFNRKWISDVEGNIYMSIVLKPKIYSSLNEFLQNITIRMAEIVVEVLDQYLVEKNIKSSIKYPNDVLVNGEKIAGILAEAKTFKNKLKVCVIGVGINLNQQKDLLRELDQPATSLNLVLDRPIDTQEFFFKLVDACEKLC